MDTPLDLRCEYARNPLGIGTAKPRFSWRCETERRGAAQTAYRVLVAGSAAALARDVGDLWDSGRVESNRSTGVVYAGSDLSSRQRCHWKVMVWDEAGRTSAFSEAAWFELALLSAEDWRATFIGSPGGDGAKARYFRTEFKIPARIIRARLYITGLGWHESFINGRKQGDAVLDPVYSDYTKRVFYAVHDAGPDLRVGDNVLGAVVGSGWHGLPILIAQLEVDCDDGSRVMVATGRALEFSQWYTATGAIVANSIFDGETFDAREDQPGWNEPGCTLREPSDRRLQWTQVFAVRGPAGSLQVQSLEPIKQVGELRPQAVNQPRPGVFVFDFGQNHAGWVRLRVTGPRGTVIRLRYAEVLAGDSTVNQENLRTADATDTYILRGGGPEDWQPRFTYHGYRYVQVEGWPGEPGPDALHSCVIRSALATRGDFDCSHPLLNQIHRLVLWTEHSNLHGIPTDCPQRNERMGWLNDLAARAEELVHNFDSIRFLEKFTQDIADTQDRRTGAISDTAPYHWGRRPADPISVAWLLIPWLLYQHTSDPRGLASHYAGLRQWVDHLSAQADDGIVRFSRYGDWAPPAAHAVAGSIGSSAVSAKTPGELISTAFYYYTVRLFSTIAATLGHAEDHATYAALTEKIRTDFHREFWHEESGGYGSGNQACNAIALYLDLVPAHLRQRVVASLVREVARHDHHLSTGNLCTKFLLEVLSSEGHGEVAAAIALQTTYPGWGHMIANGATTLWERWELLTGGGMNSHNHPMFGSIGAWLYRWVGGLAFSEPRGAVPHFLVRPPMIGAIDRARATLPTLWGEAEVRWERSNDTLEIHVRVPWNCTASVFLSPGVVHDVGAGCHDFSADFAPETQASLS